MLFMVPTTWNDNFVDLAVRYKDQISCVYGKLRYGVDRWGRSSILPGNFFGSAFKHIDALKRHHIKFNYLFDDACIYPLEYSPSGRNQLRSFLSLLEGRGVEAITVTSTYVADLVRKYSPKIRVYVSVVADVDSVSKAQHWESLGVETVAVRGCSRNFPLLEKISRSVHCKIQLIANDTCIFSCPFFIGHANAIAHVSRKGEQAQTQLIPWRVNCFLFKIRHVPEFIRSLWIRPEDVHYYEAAGIHSLQLLGQTMGLDQLGRTLGAYINRSHPGDLLDLMDDGFGHNSELAALRQELQLNVDNKALGGFMDHFINNGPCDQDCDSCGYCRTFADAAVKVSLVAQDRIIKKLEAWSCCSATNKQDKA